MASRPHKKAVCTVGTYEKNGETKKRYVNVGTLFKDSEDGRMSLKLDSMPVGQEWNGWVSFFDLDEKKDGASSGSSGGGYQAASSGGGGGSTYPDEKIPFVTWGDW